MLKRAWMIALGVALVASLACAAPPAIPEPKEPTDRVVTLRVTTSPEPELIEVDMTAQYGPGPEFEYLVADDGKLLKDYAVDAPVVTPWGYEFRLNLGTPGPLHMTARIKVRRLTKVTCKWYLQGSSTPSWTDSSHGNTTCIYQVP